MAVSFTPQNFGKDTLNIDILIFFKGKRYKRTAGVSVPRVYWIAKTQRCSENRDKFPRGIAINKALAKQRDAAERAVNYFISVIRVPDKDEFFGKMDEYLHGVNSGITFVGYAKEYIGRKVGTRADSSVKTYLSEVNMIRKYEKEKKITLGFSNINGDLYTDLQRFMYTGASKRRPYSNNYFGQMVKFVKAVYNDARNRGMHSLPPLVGFTIEAKVPDTIYLTVEELNAIHALDLSDATLRLVRAKFLFGAFTGLRVSDFNRLDELDITGDLITVTSKKTGKRVVSPLNRIVREQMAAVDITARVTDQEINRSIKQIARMAGITGAVKLNRYVGGRRVEVVSEKCEMVSSHTARRSFATNAFKAGVPAISIMKITGHTTERQFMKYIKISEEENAELMRLHEFFR